MIYGYGDYGCGGGNGAGVGTYCYDPYCTSNVVAYADSSADAQAGFGSGVYGTDADATANSQPTNPLDQNSVALAPPQTTPKPGPDADQNARVFAEKGESDFRNGDYKAAAYAWKHAIVDDPQNGVLTMMIAQALFANGEFMDAAGATQVGMRLLPKDQWGVVASNYKELYGKVGDYTTQLRALEKAVKDKPNDPALRFLAGFHYAYLGYPKEAVDQLEKGLKFAPSDEMAKKLRDEMKAKLPKSTTPPPPAPAVDSKPDKAIEKATAQQ